RPTLRSLLRNRSTTILAILTLGLGIGAATAMFSAVQGILLRPLPYPEAEEIIIISSRSTPDSDANQMSWLNYEDLRDSAESLATAAAFARSGSFVYPSGEPELTYGLMATHEIFDVLGVSPVMGRAFTAEDDREGAPDVMLVSWEFWRSRLGGDPAAVGRPLQVSSTGTTSLVIGVMPQGFRFPYDDRDASFYMPLRPELSETDRTERASVWLDVVARVAEGTTLEAANAELATISRRLEQEYLGSNRDVFFRAYPLFSEIFGGVEQSLWILFAAVGAVLLIGCANAANLLLARAAGRAREIAIRSALGASRLRIVKQLLAESVTIALVAGALGLAIGALGLRLLLAIAPRDIPRLDAVSIDWRVAGFGLALSIATGLLFGLAPALLAARSTSSKALRESSRGNTEGRGRGRVRESLVVAEIALVLLLLPAAGLLLRSYWNLMSIDSGYQYENVTMLDLSFLARHETDDQIMTAYGVVKEQLEAIPGVESVSASRMLPHMQQNWVQDFTIEGRPEPEPGRVPVADYAIVAPGYFDSLRIPILKGRAFDDRDAAGSPAVAIIGETLAKRHFAGEDPIGQRIVSGGSREIIGIAADVRELGGAGEPGQALYTPLAQNVNRRVRFLVRTSPDAGPLVNELRGVVRQFDPAQPVIEIRELATYRSEAFAARQLALSLLIGLAALAFTLAAVGIYGVMSYTVSQRSSEIGVRMAFGAEPRDIFRLVLKRVGTLLLIGALIGLFGAFASARLIARFLYGLSPSDPVTFAAILALLAGVTFLAGWFPARRAARVDPIAAMRQE
ncbi:MAG TPA: ABC transporter permease, partial [Thermoanaerobaculia bacterium]|nr:ABC transporter permease [Thermoanaerobaculia bacterium]